MKKKNILITVIVLAFAFGLGGLTLFNLNCINIEKLFSRDTLLINRSKIFDEVWGWRTEERADKIGYDLWEIGRVGTEAAATKTVTGSVVELNPEIFTYEDLNFNYYSMDDYNNNGGALVFENFIDSYYGRSSNK